MTAAPDHPSECRVALAPPDQPPAGAERSFSMDITKHGHVLNLSRAVAQSPTAFQAILRSEHMFATLRRVTPTTRAMVCLYTSMLNGCVYCLDDAAADALALDVTPETLLGLPRVPSSLPEASKLSATLHYAECVALTPSDIPAPVLEALHRHADDDELIEITAVVSMKCFWNRMAISLQVPAEGYCQNLDVYEALCRRIGDPSLRHG